MNIQEVFVKHKCDKGIKHRYWELYQEDFTKHKDDPINILEIGTFKGESTNAWLEYFSQAKRELCQYSFIPSTITPSKSNRNIF